MTVSELLARSEDDRTAGEACLRRAQNSIGTAERTLCNSAFTLSIRSIIFLCAAEICQRLDTLIEIDDLIDKGTKQ